jgi:hypothetical protein
MPSLLPVLLLITVLQGPLLQREACPVGVINMLLLMMMANMLLLLLLPMLLMCHAMVLHERVSRSRACPVSAIPSRIWATRSIHDV